MRESCSAIQAERSCIKLEEEVLSLQGQLQAQDADLAELHLKCQSAARRAAEITLSSSSAPGQATGTAAGNDSKAMQTSNTRNLLLAQVGCCSSFLLIGALILSVWFW